MTAKELAERQTWSLEQKIDHAIGTIDTFVSRTGRIPFVSFSGGKDSTVLLDICRRFIDKNFKAVFCNTGNEFPEIVDFAKNVENVTIISPKINISHIITDIGFPLVSKDVAHMIREAKTTKSIKLYNKRTMGLRNKNGSLLGKIPDKWMFLLWEKFMVSEKCCNILKKRPFAKYQRTTGQVPVIGVMACESRLRWQQYLRRGGCNSFNESHVASYPLSIWTEDDIWAYIHKFNVSVCSLYSNPKCNRTGCMFCGFGAHLEGHSRFELIYDLHPNLYKRVLGYENNGVTYREALRRIGVILPDETKQLVFNFGNNYE